MNTPAAPVGFDSAKYLREQSEAILERVQRSGNKLYLEFGGKLVQDFHAARVLPGFDPNVKLRLLQRLKDQADLLLCVHAGAIERGKVQNDFGIPYDADTFRLIDELRHWEIETTAVVVTRYTHQPAATAFVRKLRQRGIRVVTHGPTPGYPTDVDTIVSDAGYGALPPVPTERPLVVVTAPGPGSGKMATCLVQMFHDHKRGVRSGYAKFETFPIWNLPLKHPVNVAYEAATADLRDINVIDPFHLQAHGITAVNYNRDVEAFPLLKRILERITGEASPYQSPTDMGVNRAGFGIVDDAVVQDAARQEIIRRWFHYSCERALGTADDETVLRVQRLLEELGLRVEDRPVVAPARRTAEDARQRGKGNDGICCGAALRLADGTIITGRNSPLMHAASSLVLNAIKHLSGLPDAVHVLSPMTLDSIARLKQDVLRARTVSLDLNETLIALSISAATNPTAEIAMRMLKELQDCEAHLTHMPTPGDAAGLRRIGIRLTAEPQFSTKRLFLP